MASTKLYCLCRRPYETSEFMIECEVCKDWFHGRCVDIKEHQAAEIETYHCPSCQLSHGPLVLKRRRSLQRPNYSESDDNISKTIQTGTVTFMRELKQRTFSSAAEIPVVRLSGYDLTKDFLDQNGFSFPILVDTKDGLDMKVPPSNFSIQDVENYVGSMRELDVIDVAHQEDCKMLMREWTEYFNSPDRRKIYNVISLEFSNTRLVDLVEPPRIVRELSWINRFWPKTSQAFDTGLGSERQRPEIQRYCLMGVKDSYTDFHIDFGGTSVWYHILRGEKVFYFVRPTPSNLELYERWLSSSSQSQTFFGDQVDACYKCVIKQGQTVLIPTGWIHAVMTPVDSLVFGGNFLNSYNIDLQLKVYDIERRVKTPDKYLIPHYESLHWYAAGHFLDYLTECHLGGRMPPRYLIEGIKSLCSSLKSWMHRKEGGRPVAVPAVTQPNKLLRELQKELRNFLNAKERAILIDQELLDDTDDKSKRNRNKRSALASPSPGSAKKLPGSSLFSEPVFPTGYATTPLKVEKVEPLATSQFMNSDKLSFTPTPVFNDVKVGKPPAFDSKLSSVTPSVYDFEDDTDFSGLEVEVRGSDTALPPTAATAAAAAARWVDGLAASSQPLKLKVTGGKVIGSNSEHGARGHFLPLGPTPAVSSGGTDGGDVLVEQQLIVDESRAKRRSSPTKSGRQKIKLKLSVGKQKAAKGAKDTGGVVRRQSSAGDDGSVLSPTSDEDFRNRLSIPVIRGGLNSNISDILEASGYGTETDIRIDDDFSRASPTMRDAIQGMLSMSCSSLRRSPSSSAMSPTSWLKHRRMPPEDIDMKFMSCYKDNEFVYPSLELSDSEDASKSKGRTKSDEAWNPKAKVKPSCSKPNRPQRQGVRREAVECGLAAAAAKLVGPSDITPEKRTYNKHKQKVKKSLLTNDSNVLQTNKLQTSTAAATTSASTLSPAAAPVAAAGSELKRPLSEGTSSSANKSSSLSAAQQKSVTGPAVKKLKKGQATVKQRLASKLKMHKMLF